MEGKKVKLNKSHFNLDYLAEDTKIEKTESKEKYKIMIIDDDLEVHTTTRFILKDFLFQNRKLEFIDAYSMKEAIELIDKHVDVAIILLDVVMEENNSGLKLVNYIRNVKKNVFARIILRTGQPGKAPEGRVIIDYDINDYLLKTETTVQRLFTSLYQALRSYRDMVHIENHRKGLEKIIQSSSEMFIDGSIQQFFDCILNELLNFRNDKSCVCFRMKSSDNGFAYYNNGSYGTIISATGDYKKYVGKEICDIDEMSYIYKYIQDMKDVDSAEVESIENGFLVWKKSSNNVVSFIFIESDIKDYDLDLIKVFLSNYSLALDNYVISQNLIGTQVEIIHTLGDVIENRSQETANHVKRVSELSNYIGKKLGLSKEECNVLKIASMVHDAGKIGINDNILLKPGKLTKEEFEIVKTHTKIGYKIFANSNLEVLKKAANICLNHHEKYNGTGYPNGLKGEEIPLSSRIVSVTDVFDAVSHKRCYKEAWSIDEAKQYIISEKGISFDPKIVDIFIENIDEILPLYEKYPD